MAVLPLILAAATSFTLPTSNLLFAPTTPRISTIVAQDGAPSLRDQVRPHDNMPE